MNGQIAQLVALTSYANALLRGVPVQSGFFPANATCKFCERISFVEIKSSWLGNPRESEVAANPDDWFEYLARNGTLGVRLLHRSQKDTQLSERMTAGFAGGGGSWMLAARRANEVDRWMARWEVWDQNAPAQRIWRVTYGLVGTEPASWLTDENLPDALAQFKAALTRIHAFSAAHNCDPFTDCFRGAMELLPDTTVDAHHRDLQGPGTLSVSSQALLDAAQSAWVFGGMGSWNDMGFDGEDGREYDEASAQLFTAINGAICAAANQSDAE